MSTVAVRTVRSPGFSCPVDIYSSTGTKMFTLNAEYAPFNLPELPPGVADCKETFVLEAAGALPGGKPLRVQVTAWHSQLTGREPLVLPRAALILPPPPGDKAGEAGATVEALGRVEAALEQLATAAPPAPPTINVFTPEQRPRQATATRNADGSISVTYDNEAT